MEARKVTRGGAVDKWADTGEVIGQIVIEARGGSEGSDVPLTGEGSLNNSDAGEDINSNSIRDSQSNVGEEVGEEDEDVEVHRKIRCGGWNTEGLFEKLSLNGVCEYINTLDIACLGETFTFSSFGFSIKFGDFIAIHSPAKKFNIRGRPSGGLVVLIRKTLERFITIIDTKISHVLCFKINKEYLNTAKDTLHRYLCPSS